MILHLGFDICIEADKVMKHIAQSCKSQAKKSSQSVCGIPITDGNEPDCVAGSSTAPPLGWQDTILHERQE